jgi:hypothetical protein
VYVRCPSTRLWVIATELLHSGIESVRYFIWIEELHIFGEQVSVNGSGDDWTINVFH